MSSNILNSANNDKFVSKKNKDYYELTLGVKRIWLSEPLFVNCDNNKVFEIETKLGKKFEGNIIKIGEDEKGFYILFRMLDYNLTNNSFDYLPKRIPRGKINVKEVFSPENIKGGRELIQYCGGYWPYFHETLLYTERQNNNLTLHFKEGSLRDVAVDINLIGIYEEKYYGYKCKNLQYFENGNINEIKIRKLENLNYMITINNNYDEVKISEGNNCINKDIKYTVEKYHNEAVIYCSGLSIKHFNNFFYELKKREFIAVELMKSVIEMILRQENLELSGLKLLLII
ncbi:hypothetical protein CTM_17546 [Clostridium tetanomorphum DSM 665]|nr:hypothetical protein CTM_17546 [Clostridium tetanomorphum DSM 665]